MLRTQAQIQTVEIISRAEGIAADDRCAGQRVRHDGLLKPQRIIVVAVAIAEEATHIRRSAIPDPLGRVEMHRVVAPRFGVDHHRASGLVRMRDQHRLRVFRIRVDVRPSQNREVVRRGRERGRLAAEKQEVRFNATAVFGVEQIAGSESQSSAEIVRHATTEERAGAGISQDARVAGVRPRKARGHERRQVRP